MAEENEVFAAFDDVRKDYTPADLHAVIGLIRSFHPILTEKEEEWLRVIESYNEIRRKLGNTAVLRILQRLKKDNSELIPLIRNIKGGFDKATKNILDRP